MMTPMIAKFTRLLLAMFAVCALASAPLDAAQAKKLRLAFSAFAYANPPFWIAHELKLFEKYGGYETELIYVGGSRPIQAMLGGSIDVSQVGGAAAVAAAANGAEIAILGTVFSRLTFAIHASPQIKQISDLKGKTLAAGAIGGNSYFAALAFLKHFGWAPSRDVGVMTVGGSPEVLAGMLQGRFQAGVLTPPTSHAATKAGYREIFDLAGLDFPFPVISIVATRKYIDGNAEVILNVLRATSEAIYLYKTRPELTLPVVAKYMRVAKDDPALAQAQESLGKFLNQYLTPSPEGIKFVLDFLAEKQPALKNKNPNDFIDGRFVRKLDEEGFFKKVATK
jgi:ABC-type nitrate/sulfonate/bicarbonate transport system substrate-binding protein